MDAADIVIIVLAFGFSIISSIVSAINKKKKSRNLPNPGLPSENPWEVFQQDYPLGSPQSGGSQYRDYSMDENGEALDSVHDIADRSRAAGHQAVERGRETQISSIPMSVEEIEDSDGGGESLLEGFNLRTAVIYSEILKPKFEQ